MSHPELPTRRARSVILHTPASHWELAYPLGNGHLGIMTFGGVPHERIQFNEETLWSGGPAETDNPKAYATLIKVREAIEGGRPAEALELAGSGMLANPPRVDPYQTFGDIFLDFENQYWPDHYTRERCLEEATCRTWFTTRNDGDLHIRETFVSKPDNVCVMRFTCSR